MLLWWPGCLIGVRRQICGKLRVFPVLNRLKLPTSNGLSFAQIGTEGTGDER